MRRRLTPCAGKAAGPAATGWPRPMAMTTRCVAATSHTHWRMFTAYPRKKQVVIVALDKHERDHNPAADLAEVLPGLATAGRKRSAKPPCCEDAADSPAMNEELSELLSALS